MESMRENTKKLSTQFIEFFEMGIWYSKIWYMIMKSEVSAYFIFAMFCNWKWNLKEAKLFHFNITGKEHLCCMLLKYVLSIE